MNSSLKSTFTLLKKSWMLVIIMVLATLLRTHNLDQQAIFFGDAAHDLLEARDAVLQRNVPLLGIASSIPRFKQGPLTVWIEMVVYLVAQEDLLIYSLVFALLSLVAIVAVYEYSALYISKRVGILTALLVAASPLAIAQGRMAYHTNPIPLMLVLYFFALMHLWQKKKYGVFLAGLSWALLFQFELALLPIVLVIPYVIWRRFDWKKGWVRLGIQLLGGISLGLLPQILFDLTNKFAQIGGFLVWVGYRLVSTLGLVGDHVVSPNSLGRGLSQFWLYLGRVVSMDVNWIKVVVLSVWVIGLLYLIRQILKQKVKPAMEIVGIATLLLVAGFLIHSAPSEAYFPPFIILVPLVVSYFVFELRKQVMLLAVVLLTFISAINAYQVVANSYFVSTNHPFNYGMSTGEQRTVVREIAHLSDNSFRFDTTEPGGKFPSYFDNLRWMALEQDLSETEAGKPFYVESKNSPLATYPDIIKIEFKTVDVYFLP